MLNVIVSAPLPAAHSPAAAPDAVSVLAAMIASRNVHCPSLELTVSAVLLTTIGVCEGGRVTDRESVPVLPRKLPSPW